ncbi:GNAT family N-acetyltransferase [Candidatus Woesearchaeota archaeon]|nr:GNAT family N-acetyltransferase [Candidatus Woesearchaeota archaeon]
MKIRKLKKEDIKQVALLRYKLYLSWDSIDPIDKLDKKYFRSQKHYNLLNRWIKDRKRLILVAEEKGKIIAFFNSYIMERAPFLQKVGYMAEGYVDPKHRRQGTAAMLVTRTRDWFRKNKLKWIVLSTHSLDKGANRFWRNRGYKAFNIFYKKRI